MKSITTQDGIKLYCQKNEKLSINGKYKAYDFFLSKDDPETFIGTRKGVKGIKTSKFETLVTAEGLLKKQAPNTKEPTKGALQKTKEILREVVGEEEEKETKRNTKMPDIWSVPVREEHSKVGDNLQESWMVFQFNVEKPEKTDEPITLKIADIVHKKWAPSYEISGKTVNEFTTQVRMRLIITRSQRVTTNQVIDYLKEKGDLKISNIKTPSKRAEKSTEKSKETSQKKQKKVRRKRM